MLAELIDRRVYLPANPVKMTPGHLSTVHDALVVYRKHQEISPLPKGWFIDSTNNALFYTATLQKHYPNQGIGDVTVYNPSGRKANGQYLRVELENGEESVAIHHVKKNGKWYPNPDGVLPIQDPFVATVCDQLIVGGVQTRRLDENNTMYWTQFYKGTNPYNLQPWLRGPDYMKDIRPAERKDGSGIIDIYTRPFEMHIPGAGRGNIGHIVMHRDELLSLTSDDSPAFAEKLARAPLLPVKFAPSEWGGVNESTPITDENSYFKGKNLLLIHQAYYDEEGIRHYVARTLIHDPVNHDIYDRGVIGEANDFPESLPKRPDLKDILFPTSLRFRKGPQARYPFVMLEGGIRDNRYGVKIVNNPLGYAAA